MSHLVAIQTILALRFSFRRNDAHKLL